MSDPQRLVVILGPTASGKSALGIQIARRAGGEILVCDSTQVYRHFDIGTGKVPSAEQQGIPHHLADLAEPAEVFTAGDYRREAMKILEALRGRGKTPVITAGTGLYLRALLEGLADAPLRSEELRERLRGKGGSRGAEYLHHVLRRLDGAAAARIGERDTQKVIRAIEIRLLSKKTVGEIHGAGRTPLEGYEIVKIGLGPPRDALYARIHTRIDAMIATGWIEEVRRLIAAGVPREAKAFQFIGYSEWSEHLEGRLTREQAVEKIRQATRHFAKRQITWFRRESGVKWMNGFGDDPEIVSRAVEVVRGEHG
ncbi:MAG TPA: tRNA (adenosine(37)-N6)-dimethylallyltransferase MiaA [Verrucomicrobiae bacterium]|nr:tRNA (adenosine(37)-N6)-dimethylallyltransferase MiaA [Verrucomicrobiae bacterium]